MSPIIYTLPVIAAVIGWFTNYIAVKMLFRPRNKVKFLFFEFQGIFPKRQKAVAEKIGKLVSDELLSIHDIKEKFNEPESLALINEKIEVKLDEYLETTFPTNHPIMSFFLGKRNKEKLKSDFLIEIDQLAPQIVAQYIANMEGHLNIEKIIEEKISLLSPVRLEELIMQVLKKEFQFIEMIGAVIGFLIGMIQLGIVHI